MGFDAPLAGPRPDTAALPLWPVWALFGGTPLWWILGLGGFIWPMFGVVMFGYLLLRGRVSVPRGFGIWALFLVWMLASVVMIDSGPRLIGFTLRASLYVSAGIVFLYIYNAPEALTAKRMGLLFSFYFAFVVAGGYLGVLFPHGSLSTPLQYVLPGSLAHNDLVARFIHPPFAQLSDSGRTGSRPSAPFSYTNGWGCNFSLLLPFVLVAIAEVRQKLLRFALIALLPLGLIPALLTLNRGMVIGLTVGLGYAALRFTARGNGRPLLAIVLVVAAAVSISTAVGFTARLQSRLGTSQTNAGRLQIYAQSIDGTLQSPLFGHGAPQPSTVALNAPSIGTQGQVWMVLYSHGFPGIALFLGWFLVAAWRTRAFRIQAELWPHVVVLMACVEVWYYGLIYSELNIVMVAAALGLRSVRTHRRAPAASPAHGRSVMVPLERPIPLAVS